MLGFFVSQSPNQVVTLDIWRMTGKGNYNQWGDLDPQAAEAPIPALAGRTKESSVEKCVVEPRTTGINSKGDSTDRTTYTKCTVYLSDPRVDVRPGDYFAFEGANGKYEAWTLEGEGGSNNYVSPFTGIVGGREIFLMRVQERK